MPRGGRGVADGVQRGEAQSLERVSLLQLHRPPAERCRGFRNRIGARLARAGASVEIMRSALALYALRARRTRPPRRQARHFHTLAELLQIAIPVDIPQEETTRSVWFGLVGTTSPQLQTET